MGRKGRQEAFFACFLEIHHHYKISRWLGPKISKMVFFSASYKIWLDIYSRRRIMGLIHFSEIFQPYSSDGLDQGSKQIYILQFHYLEGPHSSFSNTLPHIFMMEIMEWISMYHWEGCIYWLYQESYSSQNSHQID